MCVFSKTVFCLISLLIFGNCTHLPKNSGIKSKQDKISTKQFLSKITRIPPNTCRVKATVVELDSLELIPHSTKPCEIAPCTGIIRIDSIIGYGSDFGSSLVLNDKIPVRFLFTAGPTKEVYPDSKKDLPGLSKNVSFTADINSINVISVSGETLHEYIIGEYEIIVY